MLTIYKASAGSGKTYTLAYEYIKALLGVKSPSDGKYYLNTPKHAPFARERNNRHRHILAITFTNKATEEMKTRIIGKLRALTSMPVKDKQGKLKDADYAKELCEEFGCTRRELAQVADRALKQLLYDYHYFNISTIDSFFQKVLRTFARELDRQGDYKVEINDHEAVRCSVQNMLDDFNMGHEENSPLYKWIYDYMVNLVNNGKKANFFSRTSHLHSDLVKAVTNICDETFKEHEEKMRRYLSDPEKLHTLDKQIKGLPKQITDEAQAYIKSQTSALAKEGVTPDQLGRNTLTSVIKGEKTIGDLTKGNLETMAKLVSGESSPVTKTRFKGDDRHIEALRSMAARILQVRTQIADIDVISKALSTLGLIAYVWKYLDEFTLENNTVLLSSTSHMLESIIDEDETPFIYERLGMQLHHFLIDEFQDTSALQWKNLKPLVANSLAEKHDNLIIGDEKQSIYRFRNSDWKLLNDIVPNYDFPAPKSHVVGAEEGSNTNHRSAPEVVNFNNRFFSILAKTYGLKGYGNVVQAVAEKNADKPGYVRFINAETYEPLAQEILRQHNEGGFPWKDIAILVHKNAVGGSVIDFLLENHPEIPVLSDEALFLRKSPAVRFVVSVLRLLNNEAIQAPDPDKPYYNLSDQDVQQLVSRFEFFRSQGEENEVALAKSLSDGNPADAQALLPLLERIRQRKPSSLSGMVEIVIDEAARTNMASQVIYLMAFQDFVSDFTDKGHPTLSALLDEWEARKNGLTVALSAEQDAVRVITVHKAKGLEYKCVHLPASEWSTKDENIGKWYSFPEIKGIDPDVCPPAFFIQLPVAPMAGSVFEKQSKAEKAESLTDKMNMLYVAYTRARNELIVYRSPESKPTAVSEATTQALAAMAPGLDEPVFGAPTLYADTLDKDDSEQQKEEPPRTLVIEDYPVCFHAEAEVVTNLTDALDLDRDITDTDDATEEEDSSEPVDVYENEEARQRGLLIHDILANVNTPGQLAVAIDKECTLRNVPSHLKAEAAAILENMLSCPDRLIAGWFSAEAEIRTEAAIYDPEVDRMRRPDRIVYHPDGTIDVVDYKFTSSKSPFHVRQVRRYMKLLSRIHGAQVRGYLWYAALKHPGIEQVVL